MWHVLPNGFMKIRYIGILSNRNKQSKLKLCQQATNSLLKAMEYRNITSEMILKLVSNGKAFICPACKMDEFKVIRKINIESEIANTA